MIFTHCFPKLDYFPWMDRSDDKRNLIRLNELLDDTYWAEISDLYPW